MRGNPLDFSFSGLKTAVLYRVRGTALALEAEERRAWRKEHENAGLDELRAHCSQETLDLVAGFQNAVVVDLLERTLAAAESARVDSIFVWGAWPAIPCSGRASERPSGGKDSESSSLPQHSPRTMPP